MRIKGTLAEQIARPDATGMCDAMAIALYESGVDQLAAWAILHDIGEDEPDMEFAQAVVMPNGFDVEPGSPWIDVSGSRADIPDIQSFRGSVAPCNKALIPFTRNEMLYLYTMAGVSDAEISQPHADAVQSGPSKPEPINAHQPTLIQHAHGIHATT